MPARRLTYAEIADDMEERIYLRNTRRVRGCRATAS